MLDKKNFNIENLALLSLILTPIFFIIGSLFANLAIIIIICLYFIINSKNDFLFFLKNNKFVITIFLFVFTINIFNSQYKILSFEKGIFFLRYFLFALSISFIIKFLPDKKIKIYFKSLLCIILFLIFDSFLQFYFGRDIFGFPYIESYNRITGPFGDEMIIGNYLLNIGFLSLGLINYFNKIDNKYNLLLFYFISITVLFTGERSAFLSILYFLILMFLIFNKKKFVLTTMIIIIFSSFFIIKNVDVLSNKYLPKISSKDVLLETSDENNNLNDNDNLNIYKNKIEKIFFNNKWAGHYEKAIEIFRDNVFFGSGFRTYRNVCLKIYESKDLDNLKCSIHPHNYHFEILADNGVVGYIIFLIFIFFIIIKFFKGNYYKNLSISILFCLIITFIIPFKPTGSFFTTNTAFLFWFLLGHFFGLIERKK